MAEATENWRSDVNWSDEFPPVDGSAAVWCLGSSRWLTVLMTDTACEPQIPYGEQVVSWVTVLADVAPADDWTELWHDDANARELHRLRGLALSQASETEAVLSQVLGLLDPAANRARPAGVLLNSVKAKFAEELQTDLVGSVQVLETAISRRNRLAHDTIEIGSSWQQGQYVPVIALMGADEASEADLRSELALQQQATRAAVVLLLGVDEWRRSIEG